MPTEAAVLSTEVRCQVFQAVVEEHRHREASERAAFSARRLRKRHAEGLEELLAHLDAVAADPVGAFAQMATEMLGGAGERLQTWLAAVRDRPVPAYALADETAPVFAEAWHSDWSFLEQPPIGTCLFSLVIPPIGGETGFTNQQMALAEMPVELRAKIEGRTALHSAVAAYAPDGMYGEKDKAAGRSMAIRFSEEAREVRGHPFIFEHPESGRETLLGCLGYIVGVEGMSDEDAFNLLLELHQWQTREEFQYTHKWQENMFVIWDNRSVLHKAYGGYDGYDRELHRITVAADSDKFLKLKVA